VKSEKDKGASGFTWFHPERQYWVDGEEGGDGGEGEVTHTPKMLADYGGSTVSDTRPNYETTQGPPISLNLILECAQWLYYSRYNSCLYL
jgi:hypothetical protein